MHENIARIVQLITSEIRTQKDKKEKWASFKRKHASELKNLLELDHTDFENPGTLSGPSLYIGFVDCFLILRALVPLQPR